MPTDSLLLIGAGGHARVVLDALRLEEAPRAIQLADDNAALAGGMFAGLPVLGPAWRTAPAVGHFHVAIGGNAARQRCFQEAVASGRTPWTVRHPAAIVAASSSVGPGSFLAARALLAPSSRLGAGVILNHGAIIDHDCEVGDFCHVAPGAILGGGVRVSAGAFIGAGAVILPGRTVGKAAVVGAGAVVSRSIDDHQTVVGIPARPLTAK